MKAHKIKLLLFVLVLSGCDTGPSCKDRGGKVVYSHTILIPQRIGNVTIMRQYPQYDGGECPVSDGTQVIVHLDDRWGRIDTASHWDWELI